MNDILIKIEKADSRAILPEYANEGDACMDLRILLPYDDFYGQQERQSINSGEIKVFDTGLIFEIPDNYDFKLYPRSSTGIKEGIRLANGTGILDSKYRKTLKIALQNTTSNTVFVEHQQRVAQFQVKPFPKMRILEVDKVSETNRGEGIGSSGKF